MALLRISLPNPPALDAAGTSTAPTPEGRLVEWLLRAKRKWREIAKGVLFQSGDIVKHGDEAEEEA